MAILESFVQDLRYGLRQLRQSPGFTIVAVCSLALGIGANTAIFQLVDAVRLRTLPVEKPQELATIDFAKGARRSGWFSTRSARFTYAHWETIRAQQQASGPSSSQNPFLDLMVWSATRFNLSSGGETRYAQGLYTSDGFFRVLGVNALLGRTFTAGDDRAACPNPGAVISHAFWQREFGGDHGVLGRTVSLDGHTFPILGVTPPSFFGVEVGTQYDVAIPLCADPLFFEDGKGRIPSRTAWWLAMMGRLKPGVSAKQATAYFEALSPGIMQATLPPTYRPDGAKKYLANKIEAKTASTGVSGLRSQYETPLSLLLATTGLVLVIACANLANLLLARAAGREKEMAVRLAMGAGRWRLVRQLLAESLLLAVIGAVLGAALAQVLSRGLIAFLSTTNNEVFVGLGVDARVLGFTAALAATTCVLFGLVPALRTTQLSPAAAMRASGRGTTAGRERFGLRRALVAIQVAISLVLLVGALLFVRSFRNLLTVDAGFRPEGIVSVNVDLRPLAYSKQRLPEVYRDLLQRLRSRPGVLSAAQVGWTPVSGAGWNENVRTATTPDAGKESNFNRTGPGYFQTMGTTFLAGRDFDERDSLTSPKVAIVNEAFAQRFFDGKNPVGQTFRVEGQAGKPDKVYQISGFVKNTKYYNLREDFVPIAFFPMTQDDDPGPGAAFVIKAAGSAGDIMNNAKAAVAEVSPSIGIDFRILSAQLQDSLLRERLMATLSGAFGLLAALLATLGLYGVMAYTVARRRNEIGLRMALGADRGRVLKLVLREAVLVLVIGLTAGGLAALWAGRTAETLLFGLKAHDPSTMAGAMALLAVVALLASYGPARRAAAMEPMTALREE